jgi:hypothetical protein
VGDTARRQRTPRDNLALFGSVIVLTCALAISKSGHTGLAVIVGVLLLIVLNAPAQREWSAGRRAAVADLRVRAASMTQAERQANYNALVDQWRGEGTRAMKELAEDLGVPRRNPPTLKQILNSPIGRR